MIHDCFCQPMIVSFMVHPVRLSSPIKLHPCPAMIVRESFTSWIESKIALGVKMPAGQNRLGDNYYILWLETVMAALEKLLAEHRLHLRVHMQDNRESGHDVV